MYLLYLSIVSSSHKKADKLIFAQKSKNGLFKPFLSILKIRRTQIFAKKKKDFIRILRIGIRHYADNCV